ncbi:RloB family protein [Streptomyces yaizuensis]|uniref:RloB family protein n=1 Tax=Streptomyces yaizuensis TaxID=2989713 RepID=A0ABQ5P3N4_9ACTN|nr:RloB family protein [Streptomyces sp. YSPA8]GLF97180.1 RloB family protein [Streptomyces sp. YSPA8]
MGRRGKPLKRPGSLRPEQLRFLIYCEGECTEDQYFKGLRSELRSLPVTICLGGTHGEPKSLVRAAIKHKERASASADDRFTAYDEVWCVVDVEAPKQHASLTEALALAEKADVRVALTNPCFELWILLHFRDVAGFHTSDDMQRALERAADCGYRVGRKHLDYREVAGPEGRNHLVAGERARGLRSRSADGYRANPWTDVDRLVDLLRQARARG